MKGKIFLVGNDKMLIPMEEADYVNEDELQRLLAEYWDLLPGDQIDPEDPRRWLFVGREIGVPGGTGESSWWSLDHLFLDQDAIPTFVECKRASDSRARREVVAQMLDYAANGSAYWTAAALRELAIKKPEPGAPVNEPVGRLIGSEAVADIDAFWEKVEVNLRQGRVRLIFVLDEAPRELRRLSEFLNEQMRDTEVLLLEIKQFKGLADQHALVPRLIGRTERSSQRLASRNTTAVEFLQKASAEARPFFGQVVNDGMARGYTVAWGTVGFSVRFTPPGQEQLETFAYGFPPNIFQFYFGKRLPLSAEAAAALRGRLLAFGVFQESGDRTLGTIVQGTIAPKMPEVWQQILHEIEVLRGASPDSAERTDGL
jgi:hypothetical protein